MPKTLFVRLGAVVVLVSAISCSTDEEDTALTSSNCETHYTNYSSPAAGVLTLTGNFFASETVLIQTHAAAGSRMTVANGTPATDRTSFTFTNMPSGTHEYFLVVSCEAGIDSYDVTFQVQ
jgi:hypothetical protein